MKSVSTLEGGANHPLGNTSHSRIPCQIPSYPLDRFALYYLEVIGTKASYPQVWSPYVSHQYS